MRIASSRTFVLGIYRTIAGREVLCGYVDLYFNTASRVKTSHSTVIPEGTRKWFTEAGATLAARRYEAYNPGYVARPIEIEKP